MVTTEQYQVCSRKWWSDKWSPVPSGARYINLGLTATHGFFIMSIFEVILPIIMESSVPFLPPESMASLSVMVEPPLLTSGPPLLPLSPPPSPFVFNGSVSLQNLSDKVFQTGIMTRTYLISFKKNPQWVFEFKGSAWKGLENAWVSPWKGLENAWVSPLVRGKTFGGLPEIQRELDLRGPRGDILSDPSPTTELVSSHFFIVDKSKRIITTTTMARAKSSRTAKPTSSSPAALTPTTAALPLPPLSGNVNNGDNSGKTHSASSKPVTRRRKPVRPPSAITENPPPSTKKKHKVLVMASPSLKGGERGTPQQPSQDGMVVDVAMRPFRLNGNDASTDAEPLAASLRSVFPSTETIEQRYKSDPALMAQVNGYDQHNETFLCRYWMTETEIAHRNMKWNPVGSYYALFYYISKILKWPLEEVRMVVNYDTNAVKFSQVIPQVYKLYKIEDKLAESTTLIKLVVWCIASMNSFGIIRPMIFKGTSEKSHRVEEMCASKQTYERILYYVTWPFRMDASKVYVLRNRTKLHEISMKTTFLSDLHAERDKDKLLKSIPDWVYTLVKRL